LIGWAGPRRLMIFAPLSLTVCALVNPGNFGTIDTARRLQVSRWIWAGEPPVRPGDAGFGITGRGGVLHAWYGIGQSLVLAPFDILVTSTAVPLLRRLPLGPVKEEQAATLLIAFLMQSFITACSLALAYEVLLLFRFSPQAGMAGALALLFGTTYLQYVQSAQENDLLLLLALCALYAILRWRDENRLRWAAIGGAACGFAILVRLPSVLEAAVFAVFAARIASGWRRFLAAYLPPIAIALCIDRWYQWFRFGELFGTYMGVFGRQSRPASAPETFPFSYPFAKGFLGALFSPDKSIFLYDPLLLVLLLVTVWKWRSIAAPIRAAIRCLVGLLLLYTAAYATYYDFGGDVAWGDRFLTVPVQLLCLFALPLLLLTSARSAPNLPRRAAWALVAWSIVLQASSTALAPNLEVLERERGEQHGVIVNRAINLYQIARNPENAARFAGAPIEWLSLYYLPFQLRFRFPKLAMWAISIWVALFILLLIQVRHLLGRASGYPGYS